MNVILHHRMTVDEYLAWAQTRPGRYELVDGAVYEMSPETVGHAKTKAGLYVALTTAVQRQRVPCHVLPDGLTVRIDETTAYEPDAIVFCGQEIDVTSVEVPNPVIVAEVLSPATRYIDLSSRTRHLALSDR
jgi:Uma2 family endonuclease